ncbi:MAG: branched-chain amino acid ABC transporter permease [Actinobacteria bacterium]|nr:branched-chain amino acid ABC transporter permease [Actinomycetota bacterium]
MEALVQRFPGARLGVNAVTALVIWGLLTWVNQFIEPLMSYYLATAAMYATAMFGMTILLGLSGQVSLGNGALMAIGGYIFALTSMNWQTVPILGTPWNAVWSMVFAGFGGVVFGAAIGGIAARLRGPYLAGLTLGIAVGVPAIANRFPELLGGENGLMLQVPYPAGGYTSDDTSDEAVDDGGEVPLGEEPVYEELPDDFGDFEEEFTDEFGDELDSDSGDLSDDDLLTEDDLLSEDDFLSDDDFLTDEDFTTEDGFEAGIDEEIPEEDLLSEDDFLSDDDFLTDDRLRGGLHRPESCPRPTGTRVAGGTRRPDRGGGVGNFPRRIEDQRFCGQQSVRSPRRSRVRADPDLCGSGRLHSRAFAIPSRRHRSGRTELLHRSHHRSGDLGVASGIRPRRVRGSRMAGPDNQ